MRQQKGYIALLTTIIIMAVVLTTAATVALLSIGEAQSSFALFKGEDTLQFVEGCVEDTMLKIRSDPSLAGTFTIGRPEGQCSVAIVNKTGVQWTVDVTTQDTRYKRTVRIVFNRNPTGITLTSWQEQ
ncbi:MAG: hypothetical protein HY429_02035 [Candidatus Levybacteria bacterium]|nr:hypothetical protein [Candidatus Levybacteria bacterium]